MWRGRHLGHSGQRLGLRVRRPAVPRDPDPNRHPQRRGLDRDEAAVGRRLGTELRALKPPAEDTVLLFYDSIKSAPPPVLHVCSRLLDGLYEGLGDSHPLVIGAGMLADLGLSSG